MFKLYKILSILKNKIYKIVNTIDDMIYIGSTVTNLSDRMGNHRSKAKMAHKNSKLYTHIKNLGVEHFKIILIKSFNCNNKDELEAEEYNEINIADKSKLLNENIVYKQHSDNHNKKSETHREGINHIVLILAQYSNGQVNQMKDILLIRGVLVIC